MSLLKFFQIIDSSFVGKFIDKRLDVLNNTDPDRIYVENIRSFYNIPFSVAHFFCEMAVSQNLFNKRYAIICRNSDCNRVIKTFDAKPKIGTHITCEHCELMERRPYEFDIADKDIMEYYRLNGSKGNMIIQEG